MDLDIFVQNIKSQCGRKGIKPTVACREAGVGQSFINNMEKQRSVPSVEKVQRLAHYLGVTVSELLGETPQAHPKSTLENLTLRSPDIIKLPMKDYEIISAYQRADARARSMVELALEPFMKKEDTASVG